MFKHFAIIDEWVSVLFWSWVIYRGLFSMRPRPILITGLGRVLRFVAVITTIGLLAGCSNTDPLAVASGPIFALNTGHWQPAPQDLIDPPTVIQK
jgi:Outer membrane lipoprotein virB7